jgi:hypothetical protein
MKNPTIQQFESCQNKPSDLCSNNSHNRRNKVEQEAINQKYQVKKYPCTLDKFRRANGYKEKIVSHARNKNK